MKIRIHIERLVVDAPFGGVAPAAALETAVTTRLSELFGEARWHASLATNSRLGRLACPAIEAPAFSSATRLGAAAADSLFSGLSTRFSSGKGAR